MTDTATMIRWAVTEIRELDELCRSMVPGYAPLDSADMQTLVTLAARAGSMEREDEGSELEAERALRVAAEDSAAKLARKLDDMMEEVAYILKQHG